MREEPTWRIPIGLLGLLIGLVFSIFGLRLFQLQVIEGADLRNRSDRNRVRTVRLEAQRGEIVDREGRVLAASRPAHEVAVIPNELTEREYWAQRTREVGELAGQQWSEMSEMVIAARGSDPEAIIRPEALRAMDEAESAGAHLAILSNELDLFYGANFRSKLPFLERFDTIIDATYTGILKPDPRAYESCADALSLPLENCVFVDDQMKNIKGAQAVGMQTVHFDVQRPEQSYRQAIRLLRGD